LGSKINCPTSMTPFCRRRISTCKTEPYGSRLGVKEKRSRNSARASNPCFFVGTKSGTQRWSRHPPGIAKAPCFTTFLSSSAALGESPTLSAIRSKKHFFAALPARPSRALRAAVSKRCKAQVAAWHDGRLFRAGYSPPHSLRFAHHCAGSRSKLRTACLRQKPECGSSIGHAAATSWSARVQLEQFPWQAIQRFRGILHRSIRI